MKPNVEIVQNEFDHTHPRMTADQEHEERVIGVMDKRGRRLPAMYLELSIVIGGIVLVGLYVFVTFLIRPLMK